MKAKHWLLLITGLTFLTQGCVSKQKFSELQEEYFTAKDRLSTLEEVNDSLQNVILLNKVKLGKLETELNACKKDYDNLQKLFASTERAYKNLQASYDALSKKSSAALEAQSIKTRDLIRQLEQKEQKLNEEKEKLEKLKRELDERSARIGELEQVLAKKDSILNAVQASLTASLDEFKQQGLQVHMKDGLLYVSMQNKLLFDSGSWKLKGQGISAIKKLSQVLAANPDIEITIEGHTDNVPYHGNAYIQDNWDLSVKRATTVVRELLKNDAIDPKRLIAAGRSKYHPVAPNTTPEGRAKNRRIEVILIPNMEKLKALLDEEKAKEKSQDTDDQQNQKTPAQTSPSPEK